MSTKKKEITIDLETVNEPGELVTIRNVPAIEFNGETWVDPEEVLKSKFQEIAREANLKPRQIMPLLLLYAPSGGYTNNMENMKKGWIMTQYNFNKMVFYQWKDLENIGLGNSFEKYEFKADKAGPVPIGLYEDLKELSEVGFLQIKGGAGQKKTLEVNLTPKGMQVTEEIWNKMDFPYKETTMAVKKDVHLREHDKLMGRVHTEYPEYNKNHKSKR